MSLTSRLCLALILGVASVSLIIADYQTRQETRGLKQELESHSRVLAESLGKSAEPLVASRSYRDLQRLVDRYQEREQVVAGTAVYG
ncbi:MAG TPA: hypothetical protein VEV85_04895, partial [Bryobacteraceae bacterium]|nr:hypothetical protein [Bryobacteraceae bacterium]